MSHFCRRSLRKEMGDFSKLYHKNIKSSRSDWLILCFNFKMLRGRWILLDPALCIWWSVVNQKATLEFAEIRLMQYCSLTQSVSQGRLHLFDLNRKKCSFGVHNNDLFGKNLDHKVWRRPNFFGDSNVTFPKYLSITKNMLQLTYRNSPEKITTSFGEVKKRN